MGTGGVKKAKKPDVRSDAQAEPDNVVQFRGVHFSQKKAIPGPIEKCEAASIITFNLQLGLMQTAYVPVDL